MTRLTIELTFGGLLADKHTVDLLLALADSGLRVGYDAPYLSEGDAHELLSDGSPIRLVNRDGVYPSIVLYALRKARLTYQLFSVLTSYDNRTIELWTPGMRRPRTVLVDADGKQVVRARDIRQALGSRRCTSIKQLHKRVNALLHPIPEVPELRIVK